MLKINQKLISILTVSLFIILITFFIIYEILSSSKNTKLLSEQQVVQEAKAHFQGMIDTRFWYAQYGGVYVKAKDGLKPNFYLKNNTLLTDKNETLIKINPAWMTRQISEISNKRGTYHYKTTSLKPINSSNKADKFEIQALKYFELHKDEKYFYNFNDKENSFDFMGALVTTKTCLKCHEHQGYKVGDIRGGIRVSIPTKLHTKQMLILEEKTSNSIVSVLLVSLVLTSILIWIITLFYRRQYEIENAKDILEKTVSQRTHDLEVVISHEKHLKDVLQVITEVNELLITSYSTKTILTDATTKLHENKVYSLVVSGLIRNDILDIVSQSSEKKALIPQNIISLKEFEKENYFINAIVKATKLKHPIIEKIEQCLLSENLHRREEDTNLRWMIVLPLLHGFENDIFGVITVFSSKETGFEIEEIKILENMAHDISIALYSHKQRDSILAMEKEKTANYEETILAFVNIIEQRDTYTAGHTIRVAEYCALIAIELGLNEKEIHRLEKAAILHDIGKVATPDTILLKPGKLSQLEYELIKQHSEVGADMLEKISIYKDLATIIRFHHSRYDGKGYPRTSSPEDIPMLSHIMIVADAFDAMTTNRIYRPRKSIEEAIDELKHASGTQFHPFVVDAAITALKDVNIDTTSQMPTSELEQRRMSYFFHDALTGLYNEDYLLTLLNTNEHKYKCLNIIDLKKFTLFNQENGWENGNKFLQDFAELLTTLFKTDMIIRYHGDDFIVLTSSAKCIDAQIILEQDLIKNSNIGVSVSNYKIDKYFNFEMFTKLENK
ncbi:HD domain-containing phosphohydrolase [Sulfurimonas sp.]|uniref:HD domain-containing phosphohydrolase n=1 Tax=Sulfurimonas sp. TaxID=2022749 RepID=UPI002AB2AF4A|nr:HD domain-containing phosphohydrolase [Sulfurimonas sp.]